MILTISTTSVLLMMLGKDVVVVFEEIALGVVNVGNDCSEDRKFLVNGGEVGVVGLGWGSAGSVGSIGRVGSMGRVGMVGSSGRKVGAASTEENGARKRRRSKEIREWACNEDILGLQWTLTC